MTEQQAASPLNTQDWSDEMGQRWLDHLPQFEGMIAPIGAAAIAAARLQPGERVVDVGCGAGPTTLDIAQRLGPSGYALGVDLAPMLIAAAARRMSRSGGRPGAAPVKFVCGDAATMALTTALGEPPFDVLFSRFGVMFFQDIDAAFAHMRDWLKPTGRTAFSCWAQVKENPWVLELQTITSRYVTAPEPDPDAPGPFALSDPERIRAVLGEAGFADVVLEAWRGKVAFAGPGATPAEALDVAMNGLHVGQLLADQHDDVKARVRADILTLFEKRHTKEGVLMPSCAWIVTARNGAA